MRDGHGPGAHRSARVAVWASCARLRKPPVGAPLCTVSADATRPRATHSYRSFRGRIGVLTRVLYSYLPPCLNLFCSVLNSGPVLESAIHVKARQARQGKARQGKARQGKATPAIRTFHSKSTLHTYSAGLRDSRSTTSTAAGSSGATLPAVRLGRHRYGPACERICECCDPERLARPHSDACA